LRKLVVVAGVSCLLFVLPSVASGSSLAPMVYNAFPPPPLPGNVSSVGFECCQVSEFGDEIRLSKFQSHLNRILIVMSSWACETGTWDGGDCTTTPGATFAVPITFHVYNVVAGTPDTVGHADCAKDPDVQHPVSAHIDACPVRGRQHGMVQLGR
jgi:hypothetical protein